MDFTKIEEAIQLLKGLDKNGIDQNSFNAMQARAELAEGKVVALEAKLASIREIVAMPIQATAPIAVLAPIAASKDTTTAIQTPMSFMQVMAKNTLDYQTLIESVPLSEHLKQTIKSTIGNSTKLTLDQANAYMRLPKRRIEGLIGTTSKPGVFGGIKPKVTDMLEYYRTAKVGANPLVTLKDIPQIIFQCHVQRYLNISAAEVSNLVDSGDLMPYAINGAVRVFDWADVIGYAQKAKITVTPTLVEHLFYYHLKDRYMATTGHDGFLHVFKDSVMSNEATDDDPYIITQVCPELLPLIQHYKGGIFKMRTRPLVNHWLPMVLADMQKLTAAQYLHKYCTANDDGTLVKYKFGSNGGFVEA